MILRKYRVWCNTESAWAHVWAESIPSTCPNNNGHSIDTSKTVIEDSLSDEVTLTSQVENHKIDGYDLTYKMLSFLYDIPDSAGPHSFDISFHNDIMLLGGCVEPHSGMVGDSVKFETLAETVVGQLTEAVAVDDNHIHVNEGLMAYVWKAFAVNAVTLDEYGQIATSTYIAHVQSRGDNLLNLCTLAPNAHNAGTYLSTSYTAVEKMRIMNTNTIWISRDTDRGALIPANTPMKFYYYNDVGGAKKAQITLEVYV